MTYSNDSTWLQVTGGKEPAIIVTDQLDRIVRTLAQPQEQTPRLVHFIGRAHKYAALKYLFPHNNFGRKRDRCFISLRIDTSSTKQSSPLLITHSDVQNHFMIPARSQCQEPYLRLPLELKNFDVACADLCDDLEARILFPVADLICVFIEDFSSLDFLFQKIEKWIQVQGMQTFPEHVLPQLLLVASEQVMPTTFTDFINRRSVWLGQMFGSVEVFHLGDDALSPIARYRRLREMIKTQTMHQLDLRRQLCLQLSASHFTALFSKRVQHCAQSPSLIFDTTEAARSLSQSVGDMSAHVAKFVCTATEMHFTEKEIVEGVASAIFADAYPPNMHPFLWSAMYSHYDRLLLNSCGVDLNPGVIAAFASFFQMYMTGISSLGIRRQCLDRHKTAFSKIRSTSTCLFCLARAPEHDLPCGHTICDICVQRFGETAPSSRHQFALRQCLVCGSSVQQLISIKPATAGIRIISIDGGGVRGAVPLESLCILQQILGDLPVSSCFDLAIGTSSGGLIVLALFALAWTPQRCSEAFDNFTRQIFGKDEKFSSTSSLIKKGLKCLVKDAVYDHSSLESCLKLIYGHSSKLFGSPHNESSGSKCAVTTSAIADGTPYLVASYNGGDSSRKTKGYEVLRPHDTRCEPLIWEAARATSAVPVLFQSFNIADIGNFQDGGLKHNNPSRMACWESRRIWPEVKAPDVFLSLGTGVPQNVGNRPSRFRNFFMDGFIPRLFRSCMAKSDGEIMWTEFMNSLDDVNKPNYFRLNIPLNGAALINDVHSMASLRTSVRSQMDSTRVEVVRALLVSSFYFELEEKPVYEDGSYLVKGTIFCRNNAFQTVKALQSIGLQTADFSTDFETVACPKMFEDIICHSCHCLRQNVSFYIRSLDESVCIYICPEGLPRQKISGFPQTMRWFQEQQGFCAAFGTATHDTPGRNSCKVCDPGRQKQVKRVLFQTQPNTTRKRPRLTK